MDKQTILQAVSEVTGVPIEDILMDSDIPGARVGLKVFARQMCMEIAYSDSPRDLKQIAHFYNRIYSNVLHAVKTVRNDIERDLYRRRLYDDTMREIKRLEWGETYPTTEDLSDDEYQDLTSEALKFQTNARV